MKTCGNCKHQKEEPEFNFKSKVKGTLQSNCRVCEKEKKRKHYIANKQYYVDKAVKRSKELRAKFKEFKSTLNCLVCNESESVCLDFHHLDSTSKDIEIAIATTAMGKEKFQQELDKCIVLCSNCHRKVHAGIIQI